MVAVGGRVDSACREKDAFDRILSLETCEVVEEESMLRGGELLRGIGEELREVLRRLCE